MSTHTFQLATVTVTINLTPADEAILADQVIDNVDWLRGFANMVQDKIDVVKGRIVDAEVHEAIMTGTVNQLPTATDEIVAAKFARSNYKNRAEREKLSNA